MKTQIVTLSKTAGWLVVTLGLVHTGFTLVIVNDIASLPLQWQSTFIFMFASTGLGCLLAGAIMLLTSGNELKNSNTANHIFIISSTFMLLLGIGAPVAMSNNPFGYISLLIGIFSMSVALLRYLKKE